MPPLEVKFDGASYWLWDGFHRRWGADRAGLEKLPCNVTNGTQQDAQWASYGANKDHGLRRGNEDKKKAVKAALRHPNGPKCSDHDLAEHCGVAVNTVCKYRAELVASMQIAQIDTRTVTRNGKTYEQNTANIGKGKLDVRNSERDDDHHPVADDSDDDQDADGGAEPVTSGPLAEMEADPVGVDSDDQPKDRVTWLLAQLDLMWGDYQAVFADDADWISWRVAQENFAILKGQD
jgi:hypothetical protein